MRSLVSRLVVSLNTGDSREYLRSGDDDYIPKVDLQSPGKHSDVETCHWHFLFIS